MSLVKYQKRLSFINIFYTLKNFFAAYTCGWLFLESCLFYKRVFRAIPIFTKSGMLLTFLIL